MSELTKGCGTAAAKRFGKGTLQRFASSRGAHPDVTIIIQRKGDDNLALIPSPAADFLARPACTKQRPPAGADGRSRCSAHAVPIMRRVPQHALRTARKLLEEDHARR